MVKAEEAVAVTVDGDKARLLRGAGAAGAARGVQPDRTSGF
jgi:hypothetical protein